MKVKTACNCKSSFEENPMQPKINTKAELLQLNHTPFICMGNFINKKVGNPKKKLSPSTFKTDVST